MTIAICGGAGYIGSHAVIALQDRGDKVIVIDNLSTGHVEAIPPGVTLYKGDIRDTSFLDVVFLRKKSHLSCTLLLTRLLVLVLKNL